jgi:hypothetical protein
MLYSRNLRRVALVRTEVLEEIIALNTGVKKSATNVKC